MRYVKTKIVSAFAFVVAAALLSVQPLQVYAASNTQAVLKTMDPGIFHITPTLPTGAWGTGTYQVILDRNQINDSGLGIKRLEYQIAGAIMQDWSTYNGSIVISAHGETIITVRATDTAGDIRLASTSLKIDNKPPSSPKINLIQSGWTSNEISFSIVDGIDTDGSGIQKSQYRVGPSGQWTDYTGIVTVNASGAKEIYARTLDQVGLISDVALLQPQIDQAAPSAPTISSSIQTWTNQDVVITIQHGRDDESGVQKSQYRFGQAGAWLDYGGPFTINFEGKTDVYARTLDKAGNISSAASIAGAAKIDKTPPSMPTIELGAAAAASNSITMTLLNGVDTGSGVLKSQYMLGQNGQWIDYTQPVVLSNEGKTIIYARTLDNAGNVSGSAAATADNQKANPLAPVIQLSHDKWTNQAITVAISGGAGGKNEYKIGDNGAWVSYSNPFILSQEGQTTIYSRSFDAAGNEAAQTSKIARIDLTPPTAPTYWVSNNWSHQDVTFVVNNGSDKGSGIQKSQYRINSMGQWIDYSAPVTLSTEGQTDVYFRTLDYAGNTSNTTMTTIRINRNKDGYPSNVYRPDVSNMQVNANPLSDRVEISWIGEAQGYEYSIRRDGFELYRSTKANYIDYGVTPGRAYTYQIDFLNAGYTLPVKTINVTIPYPKMDITSTKNVGKIAEKSIEFKLPTIPGAQKYTVTTANGTILYNGSEPVFMINNLQPGTTYAFDIFYTLNAVPSQKTELTLSTAGSSTGTPSGGQTEKPSGENGGFTDIEGIFSKEAIRQLSQKGIIKGSTVNTFEPHRSVTRAEFMAMVVRITGHKADRVYDGIFTDVSSDDWFFPEFQAAWQFRIIEGRSLTTFAPNEVVTREQAATIIARIFSKKNANGLKGVKYKDAGDISSYAKEAVSYLANDGIINGYEDDTFRPQAALNRAEAAAILYRIIGGNK